MDTSGIHSGSWVVGFWARHHGAHFSEASLFGIGRTAWYGFDPTAQDPRFYTYHPNRVMRTLIALNIATAVYRRVTTARLPSPHAELARGFPVLLEVNEARLTPAGSGQDGYCLCYMGQAGEASPELIPVHTPHNVEEPLAVEAGTLVSAWQQPTPLGYQHTVYVPMARTIATSLAHVIPHSISQYVAQMTESLSGERPGGLDGLRAFIRYCRRNDSAVATTLHGALESDGGPHSQRTLMSHFLLEAAAILGQPSLRAVATLYEEIAALWIEVMRSVALKLLPTTICDALDGILQLETAAVGTLARLQS